MASSVDPEGSVVSRGWVAICLDDGNPPPAYPYEWLVHKVHAQPIGKKYYSSRYVLIAWDPTRFRWAGSGLGDVQVATVNGNAFYLIGV